MIDIEKIRTTIVNFVENNLSCSVILANQTEKIPSHPYISFTITTPLISNNGSYGRYDDGINRKQVKQTWSFTAQSKTHDEAFVFAMKAHNLFEDYLSCTKLYQEQGISVVSLGNITNRDTLLSNFYEYRCGFDVTFSMFDEVSALAEGQIESADIKYKEKI